MIGYAILGLSVLIGYCLTIACALIGTMGLASAAPRFVIANHRVRGMYKLTHEVMWFLCVVVGSFVTARIGLGMSEWLQEIALTGVLLLMLWRNTWEARQRGIAHQILISLLTVAGVLIGFSLRNKLFA
jgi:hypothetical protein